MGPLTGPHTKLALAPDAHERMPERKDQGELPTRAFKSQKEWEAWLERNHETPGE